MVNSFARTPESLFTNQNSFPALIFLTANLLPFALGNRDANQEIINATTSRNSSPEIAGRSQYPANSS